MRRALPRTVLAAVSVSLVVACGADGDRDVAQTPPTPAVPAPSVGAPSEVPSAAPSTAPSTALTGTAPTSVPAPSAPPAPPAPTSSGAPGEQRVGALLFRVPAAWKGVDLKAPDLEQQLERLDVPSASRRQVLEQRRGAQTFDEVSLFFDPRQLRAGNVIVGRISGPTDPSVRELEGAAEAAGEALGNRTPSVRRIRVADREAVLLTVTMPGGGERVMQRQVYLPGERQFYLLGFTYSPDRGSRSQDKAFEEFRRSVRFDPAQV